MTYFQDYFLWSEQQAALLRRLAAGERVNDAVDWPNVLEEVEDVGQSGLRAVKSSLRQAMVHRLKALAWPQCRDAEKWEANAAREFQLAAQDAFTPSMRQRIDVDAIYANALASIPKAIDGKAAGPVPPICPWTLDELLR